MTTYSDSPEHLAMENSWISSNDSNLVKTFIKKSKHLFSSKQSVSTDPSAIADLKANSDPGHDYCSVLSYPLDLAGELTFIHHSNSKEFVARYENSSNKANYKKIFSKLKTKSSKSFSAEELHHNYCQQQPNLYDPRQHLHHNTTSSINIDNDKTILLSDFNVPTVQFSTTTNTSAVTHPHKYLQLNKNFSQKSLRSHLSIPTIASQDSSVSSIESSIFSHNVTANNSSISSTSGSNLVNRSQQSIAQKKQQLELSSPFSNYNPEIVNLFLTLANDEFQLTFSSFKHFYTSQNNSFVSDEHLTHIFSQFTSNSENTMGFKEFEQFLSSNEFNSPFRSDLALEDYSRPINEYFISSSHNTYLIGRQVGGVSSIDWYIHTLKKGCRCVEIDIWNGDNGPVVSHGLTLTSSVSLTKVVQIVKEYAFVASDLPLILSVEIHCKKAYQLTVKKVLIDGLGDLLLTKSLTESGAEDRLPSVAELRNKILIKIKRSNSFVSKEAGSSTNSLIGAAFTSASATTETAVTASHSVTRSTNIAVTHPSTSGFFFNGSSSSSSSSSSSDCSSGEIDSDNFHYKITTVSRHKKKQKQSSFKIIPELCQMSHYVYGVKFKGFELHEAKTFNHCFSFSNRKLSSMLKNSSKNALSVHNHNLNHLMRIYPAGYKITSKNFDPIPFWKFGCQLVATNWQTYDLGEEINESMFNYGNKGGYILKPEYLRHASTEKNRLIKNFNISNKYIKSLKFSIDIISAELGSDLDVDSPYVTLQVLGHDGHLADVQYSSSVKSLQSPYNTQNFGNNNCPASYYEEESIYKTGASHLISNQPVWSTNFSGQVEKCLKEFIFLKFTINNENYNYYNYINGNYIGNSDYKASLTVRLMYLNQGYRFLPLYDTKGNELPNSKLFVKINVEET